MAAEEIECHVCGAGNPKDSERCRSCGARLSEVASELTEEELYARRHQPDGFEIRWVFISFGLFLVMAALALATPTLSLVGGTMAALTVGLKRGGGLMSLLILPVVMPALIFGARATDLAATGLEPAGALYLLAALLFLALGLTPFAMASAMRISLD